MTPTEFTVAIWTIMDRYRGDHEASHAETDDLMFLVLRQLGYGEGVDLMLSAPGWCA